MKIYTKLRSIFDNTPVSFEGIVLGLLAQGQCELSHYPVDLLSLKRGLFSTCEFILNKIILEPKYFKGDFAAINNYFIHINRLIEAYIPAQHSNKANQEMKKLICSILIEQYGYQQASGLSFHNNEMIMGRTAALGNPQAIEWYQSAISDPENQQEIWYPVIVGAYECEKSKWDFSFPEKGIFHLKTALFQAASLPDFQENPVYFVDFLNVILFELIYPLKNEKIKFQQVQDVFDLVFSMYKKYDLYEMCLPEFNDIVERYALPQNDEEWLMKQIQALEQQSKCPSSDIPHQDILKKGFNYAVELARLNEEEGQEKALKLMSEIFESCGVVTD